MLYKIPQEIIVGTTNRNNHVEDLYVSTDQVIAIEKQTFSFPFSDETTEYYILTLSNGLRVQLKFNDNISVNKFVNNYNYICGERY